MDLYLEKANPLGSQHAGTKYVARVQVGMTKTGKPMYRYFKTADEYKTYLKNRGRKDKHKKKNKRGKELEEKLKQEQEVSRRKQQESGRSSVHKSVALFVGVD